MSARNDAIQKAVDWWSEKLQACKNSGLSDDDRKGGKYRDYEIAEALFTVLKPSVTDEQISKFKSSLLKSLHELSPETWIYLTVDYGPDLNLSRALQDAGIPNMTGVLPIKTSMTINGDVVEVAYGYGAQWEKL